MTFLGMNTEQVSAQATRIDAGERRLEGLADLDRYVEAAGVG